MGYEIRLPQISGTTTAEQLMQIKSYLHQTVEQLNYAFTLFENEGVVIRQQVAASTAPKTDEEIASNFNDIKSLIIKSADIVNAYSETITNQLKGEYVAISDFGTYTSVTDKKIKETSERTTENYNNIQTIISNVDEIKNSVIDVEAHIITGLLYHNEEGIPIYGVQIGQNTKVNGEEVFNQFMQITANRLSFFDSNGYETAWISDKNLSIINAEIRGNLRQGGYKIDSTNGLAWKWVGRS